MSDSSDDVFDSRASLDTIFRPTSSDSINSADVLLVGFEDGTIHLSIYDFFEIGTFKLLHSLDPAAKCKPLMHCFHPLSTTQSLLVFKLQDGDNGLNLIPLDLRLLSNAGNHLSTLASKSTQLRNLLRYIRQVQAQIYGDYKAAQDLPSRFIANIEEPLIEQGEWTWIQAAYHLVVTGNCPNTIKEWLVDQLGERVSNDSFFHFKHY